MRGGEKIGTHNLCTITFFFLPKVMSFIR